VQEKIGANLTIRLNQRMHRFRMGRSFLPRRCRSYHSFDIEFVGIEQQPNERHLIVRLVANVAYYYDPWAAGKIIYVRRRKSLALKGTT
jgi:hypothetical protein